MRIRGTKPEFWRSRRIASVCWEARLVLKGLESYVDDNGVGKDDVELITGDIFSRDLAREGSRVLARVSEAISALLDAGLLWRYEVDGNEYLYVSFWEQSQRIDKPGKGRFPRPDGTWEYGGSEIRESLASPREPSRALAPVTGEQGNRGTEKQTRSSAGADDLESDFETWWKSYPRKIAKVPAKKAFKTARKTADLQTLISAIENQAPRLMAKGVDFCPYPSTWLNGQRWLDETPAPAAEPRPNGWMQAERKIPESWLEPEEAQA